MAATAAAGTRMVEVAGAGGQITTVGHREYAAVLTAILLRLNKMLTYVAYVSSCRVLNRWVVGFILGLDETQFFRRF